MIKLLFPSCSRKWRQEKVTPSQGEFMICFQVAWVHQRAHPLSAFSHLSLALTPVGFPDDARGKEPSCQCGRCKRHRFYPCVRNITWKKAWQPTPVFLPGESHGQSCLAGYSPQVCKELDIIEAWETLGWRKHKLKPRLPGEISITSDMQMTPPYGRKLRTKEPLDERERGEWKSWLKAQHSEN